MRVGLVGTGYAAKLRAEAFRADPRSQLVGVTGQDRDRTLAFCQPFEVEPIADWHTLVQHDSVDLVVIATMNREHGAIARQALEAGKHLVVEYPLALDLAEAESLVKLARSQQRLLHVEHIELLSGIHLALVEALPAIGQPIYVRSQSLKAQYPSPRKWTYCTELFGFPLVGALSRIHRLTNLFGTVNRVQAQAQFWQGDRPKIPPDQHHTTCLCSAQLQFDSGLLAEVIYGKGEGIWQSDRTLEIHGTEGMIRISGTDGELTTREKTQPLAIGSRRGLFAQDTRSVLDYLESGTPLYVQPESSLYALQVAIAAQQSAQQP